MSRAIACSIGGGEVLEKREVTGHGQKVYIEAPLFTLYDGQEVKEMVPMELTSHDGYGS